MPAQTFQSSALTSAPVARVWRSLDDPSSWEAVPGVDRIVDPVHDETGALTGFLFETVIAGKPYVGIAKPSGRVVGRSMAWEITTAEVKGEITVILTPRDRSTMVDVELRVESVTMLSSIFFPVIATAISEGFSSAIDDFAQSLE